MDSFSLNKSHAQALAELRPFLFSGSTPDRTLARLGFFIGLSFFEFVPTLPLLLLHLVTNIELFLYVVSCLRDIFFSSS